MTQTIALTGGSGFVGGALIRRLLEEGFTVKALARNPAAMPGARNLQIIKGSLEDAGALEDFARGSNAFIHSAGLTHARRDQDFFAVNVGGARAAAKAAARCGARLVHLSSMAARQPGLSAYARSKRESEAAVAEGAAGSPWLALRLPAIYGPGDEATLPYFRMVKRGVAPEPAADPPPRASILYVEDIANAILTALREAPPGEIYEVGDERPDGHSWQAIGETLALALGVRARRLRAPRAILSSYAAAASGIARAAGRAPMVTPGKIREFFHPDWVARDNLLAGATGWRPKTPLKEGFAKTVRWYQENGLL